jgi:hypothetical protein
MKTDSTEIVEQTSDGIGSFDITIGIIANLLCWVLANVEKISSLILSVLSIAYLLWRWRKEYLRDKKPRSR